MTIKELKSEILNIIQQIYNKKYIGKLDIQKLTNGYSLILYINKEYSPLVISAELNAEDFLKYCKQELKTSKLNHVQYFTGIKQYQDQLNCYEKLK